MNGGWQRMPVPADVDVGGSASLGSAAFQELTKHVEDVRVSEHQLVNGKPVTIIAGEVDTVGLLGSVSELASLSGSAPEGMQLPDFEQLGAKIGDIRAVLTIDEGTHLLSSAIVKLSVEAAGEQLDVELRYRLTAANEPVRIPSPSA
jgi:mannose/fructose/N-acetylgalactosamine-specific phosphotransferase system component IIC